MEKELLDKCPSCDQDDFSLFVESNGEKIVKCNYCELLFVNPRPTESAIKKLFVEDYIETEERVTEDFTNWRIDSLKREADCIKLMLPSGGNLLDLGTASGFFLGLFADTSGWKVEGVEPSRYAAKAASEKYNVNVYAGFLGDQNLPSQSFDIVTSLDAFCFHPHPNKDIQEIKRILKEDGLFALEIPGLSFRLLKNKGLFSRLIYGVPARLNAGVHLIYYNRKTLGEMLERHGFQEVKNLPERSPEYGPAIFRFLTRIYYNITSVLYRLTNGASWVPVPKEFLVYKKVEE